MKKITLFIYLAIACLAFQSCKKTSPGDVTNMDGVLPPYVTLTSKVISPKAGAATANVAINMRSGLQQAVTVTYNLTGIVTASNQTVVLAKEALTVNAVVTRPTTGTVNGTVSLTIVKAVTADGQALTIGQDNVAANQVAVITFN